MSQILTNINKIVRDRGLKQESLAKALGVKQPAVSELLSEKRPIKYCELECLAEFFGMRVIDVITYPAVYVPSTDSCDCPECKRKDRIIDALLRRI